MPGVLSGLRSHLSRRATPLSPSNLPLLSPLSAGWSQGSWPSPQECGWTGLGPGGGLLRPGFRPTAQPPGKATPCWGWEAQSGWADWGLRWTDEGHRAWSQPIWPGWSHDPTCRRCHPSSGLRKQVTCCSSLRVHQPLQTLPLAPGTPGGNRTPSTTAPRADRSCGVSVLICALRPLFPPIRWGDSSPPTTPALY